MIKLSKYLLLNSVLYLNMNTYIVFEITLEILNKVNYIYFKLK